MRILLVHNYYRYRGGEERYLSSVAKLLRAKGHKVFIWSKDNREIGNSLLRKIKIAAGMFWNKNTQEELSEVIEKFKPDIVHFNNIFPQISPTAYYVCKKYKLPVVQTIHNFRYMFPKSVLIRRGELCTYCLEKRLIYPAVIHKCYNQSLAYTVVYSFSHIFHSFINSFGLVDGYIFPSRFARSYYLENSRISSLKTYVIPNFISFKARKLNKEKKDYFLYVGGLAEEKGIIELLEVFSSLPKLKLLVIGDGPQRKEVTRYKKYKNITIRGSLPQKQVYKYMGEALFTIIPSKCYEVMPTVLIESFANGTAVIVPKLGVFKELVKDKKSGIFYKYNDSKDLRAKIIKMGKKKTLAKKMSPLARKEANKYLADMYYKKLLGVYTELMAKASVS